jgi:branched-chain amino acid transport system substrate-binding protein
MGMKLAAAMISFGLLLGLSVSLAVGQPKEVVIGIPYPMSGPIGQAGVDGKVAFELARDIANGEVDIPFPLYQRFKGMPKLGGAKVRLIIVDHQGKPELGQAAAERLITQDKVHALLGALHSGVTATASFVAERHQIPFITAASDFGSKNFFGGIGAYVPFGGAVKWDKRDSFAGNPAWADCSSGANRPAATRDIMSGALR